MEEVHILSTSEGISQCACCWASEWQESYLDQLVRANLSKLEESGRYEPCGKKICLVCESISTTTTCILEACHENFKIQKGPLNCDSEKVVYLLKYKNAW